MTTLKATPLVSGYPQHTSAIPGFAESSGPYEVRFARNAADLESIQKLRFEVFNLEMAEGLAGSYATCRDEDDYDAHCHHLVVTERASGAVIGTYRMQTESMATALGFYSETEFDLSALRRAFLPRAVELGRACIDAGHRNTRVLFLLWRGLAAYMLQNDKRYFFGCCSLTSQDPAEGLRLYDQLEASGQIDSQWRVTPQPSRACVAHDETGPPVRIPKLMRTYLQYGARIAGPPALDTEFKTIDYLAVFDLDGISARIAKLFLSGL